ncbi:MAG: ATP-binding protein [candidate division Zixibacteria bacterium]|nr:ATP-binding protein [candidate division Zixibacteria bacterium]MBU1472136.1 ATP-binding protein [candidate division Zixibacteria bacterium]MBU2625669.1 ATP-binding protein [candidate division Zixibacteria bacterium]
MNDSIRVQVPSDSNYLNWVYTISMAIMSELPLDDRISYFLLVAISEGFTNAYLHGNQKEADKQIVLSYDIGDEFLTVTIEDEGVLPFTRKLEEVTRPVDDDSESGRGLAIIERYIDEVDIHHEPGRGNILTMKVSLDTHTQDQKPIQREVACEY